MLRRELFLCVKLRFMLQGFPSCQWETACQQDWETECDWGRRAVGTGGSMAGRAGLIGCQRGTQSWWVGTRGQIGNKLSKTTIIWGSIRCLNGIGTTSSKKNTRASF